MSPSYESILRPHWYVLQLRSIYLPFIYALVFQMLFFHQKFAPIRAAVGCTYKRKESAQRCEPGIDVKFSFHTVAQVRVFGREFFVLFCFVL